MDTLRDDLNLAGKRFQQQPQRTRKYVCTCYAQEFFPITYSFRYNGQTGTNV